MATYGYLCPTPKGHCKGTPAKLSAGIEKIGLKKHGSAEEAMSCYSAYLVDVLGAEKLSRREFRLPNDGGIMLLSKPHSFGARLKAGKRGDNMQGSDRGMPRTGKSAVIIST